MEKLGIVVLNYNDWRTTEKIVKHVSGLADIDSIAVVDNCSTDDSREHLLLLENVKTKVIFSQRNGGYSAGNNLGIRYLIEERKVGLIIVSNPDIIFEQDFIDQGRHFLSDDDSLVSVTGVMKYPSGDYDKHPFLILPKFGRVLAGFILPLDVLLSKLRKDDYTLDKTQDLQYVESLPGCLYMIKADFIRAIGYFDEGTFLYYEEAILGRQIMSQGKRCAVMTKVDYIHDHAKTIKKNLDKLHINKMYNQSGLYFFKKYHKINKFQQMMYKALSWLNILQYKLLYSIKK